MPQEDQPQHTEERGEAAPNASPTAKRPWLDALFSIGQDGLMQNVAQYLTSGSATLATAAFVIATAKAIEGDSAYSWLFVYPAYFAAALLAIWAGRSYLAGFHRAISARRPRHRIGECLTAAFAAVGTFSLGAAVVMVCLHYLGTLPSKATHQQTPPAAHHASSWRFAVSVTEQDH